MIRSSGGCARGSARPSRSLRIGRPRRAPATRWITAAAAALGAGLALAASAAQEFNGRVSIADGGPLTVIRRDELLSGSRGGTLLAGDMIQTSPETFAVIEVGDSATIGLGPATQLYVQQRGEQTILMVPKGWIKVDCRSGSVRLVGRRLGVEVRQGVVLLHADERADALFDEQGPASLLLHDGASLRAGQQTQAGQFYLRMGGDALIVQPRPSAEFVERMPVPFRDPLPTGVAMRAGSTALQSVRTVTYADVQPWLTMPPDWRGGLIERFRGRLQDHAFFAAMEAHLAQHPEWKRVLYPPPPEGAPGESPPPVSSTTH